MPTALRALRGATTFDHDESQHVSDRVKDLVTEMLASNTIQHDDIISIVFTATDDLTSVFPAKAARELGLGDVPLLCARELAIENSKPRCIRVLMHISTDLSRSELRHVYLHEAKSLRDDLPL